MDVLDDRGVLWMIGCFVLDDGDGSMTGLLDIDVSTDPETSSG